MVAIGKKNKKLLLDFVSSELSHSFTFMRTLLLLASNNFHQQKVFHRWKLLNVLSKTETKSTVNQKLQTTKEKVEKTQKSKTKFSKK